MRQFLDMLFTATALAGRYRAGSREGCCVHPTELLARPAFPRPGPDQLSFPLMNSQDITWLSAPDAGTVEPVTTAPHT